jgi:hypothetical protein
MTYKIQPYTEAQAKKLGVSVRPSAAAGKKLDVFRGTKKIASIGALGMGDYPTYLKEEGKAFAEERRRLYKIRHAKDKGVAGRLAGALLW